MHFGKRSQGGVNRKEMNELETLTLPHQPIFLACLIKPYYS